MFRFWFNTFFIDMYLLQQQNPVGPRQLHADHRQLHADHRQHTRYTSTVPRQDADDDITTGVPAVHENSSKTDPFT